MKFSKAITLDQFKETINKIDTQIYALANELSQQGFFGHVADIYTDPDKKQKIEAAVNKIWDGLNTTQQAIFDIKAIDSRVATILKAQEGTGCSESNTSTSLGHAYDYIKNKDIPDPRKKRKKKKSAIDLFLKDN